MLILIALAFFAGFFFGVVWGSDEPSR